MQKSIIIIGAGMAGLSAGCYAQMNGYTTQIFEQHVVPGGVCTSWKRKGYTFDCCIHNLGGSGEASDFHRVWRELGAIPARPMISYNEFVQVEEGTHVFTVFTDIDKLETHMKTLSPADAKVIEEFTNSVRRFNGFKLFSAAMTGTWGLMGGVMSSPSLMKWTRINLQQYATRFTDPFLRKAFPTLMYDVDITPMLFLLNFLASMHQRDLGWPIGGSLEFSKAIAERYRALGGTLHQKSRVTTILVENDRAVGVVLADGTEHRADIVVSNADGRTTIFDMLGGRYTNERIRAYYAKPDERQVMTVHASFGVNRDISDEPHALVLFLEKPITVMDEEVDRLDVELTSHDASMAPPGKGVIKVVLNSSYAYWKSLYQTYDVYEKEKQHLAETLAGALEIRFPGFKEQIEVVDVATPMTFERYTGAWQGFQARAPIEGLGDFLNFLRGKGWCRTLPGLKNFYMIGQWAGDFGLANAATSGRNLIKSICKSDGKRFRSE
ncbi:MAG: phytoene desaturase family protein [Halobacteriota archaeon]